MAEEKKDIKVRLPNEVKGGVYANSLSIVHTPEEFILDFLMVSPPEGVVTARVIVSPGHVKRIFSALQDNIAKYEKNYGMIKQTRAPKIMGFVKTP
jgi:hypothetical protein